ncbi:hypothetical protein BDZ89DRAFT_1065180 [Hymenopellis radicata]|nr:hypothetical protein BDZ89DRAFT_1065180 [Hymenopellis radicata]
MTGLSLMKETAISFRFLVSGRVHRCTMRKRWATRQIHASSLSLSGFSHHVHARA